MEFLCFSQFIEKNAGLDGEEMCGTLLFMVIVEVIVNWEEKRNRTVIQKK